MLNFFFKKKAVEPPAIAADHRDNGKPLRALILAASKQNQNWFRDIEMARQTASMFLTECYTYEAYDWRIDKLIEDLFPDGLDFIFINYNAHYTYKLTGFDQIDVPVLGFVGDHYDFTATSESALRKQAFFKKINLWAMVTAYPHTNPSVAQALGKEDLAFLYMPWAVDPQHYYDLGKKRRYDIAVIGALTAEKYPFRRMVRTWMEEQKQLKFIRKSRFGGHDALRFNEALNKTRSAFSCASAMHYTLMKYFEIPASGTLLFGETTPELEALGFVDAEHYVAVTPENYQERMLYYLKGEGIEAGVRIARQGSVFVRSEHTWEKRIAEFLKTLSERM